MFSVLYEKAMKIRFLSFIVLHQMINGFTLYYLACFNIIYRKSSNSWMIGALTSLAMELLLFSIGLPLMNALVRLAARKCKVMRYFYYNNVLKDG